MADAVRVGEGGGRGDVGGGEASDSGGMASGVVSKDAWANNRDNEDGPAFGDEFDLDRTGKRCEVGGSVVSNASSVRCEATGGAVRKGSSTSAWAGEACKVNGEKGPGIESFISLSDVFFEEGRLLFECEDCVQSSTSSM
jgi:hypothetical protein